MKAKEYRAMSPDEQREELRKLRREQFNLRIQAATGQAAKPDQHKKARRDIARLKTVMREQTSSTKGEK
jgi:large subunit ribosomal protein L29